MLKKLYCLDYIAVVLGPISCLEKKFLKRVNIKGFMNRRLFLKKDLVIFVALITPYYGKLDIGRKNNNNQKGFLSRGDVKVNSFIKNI